MNQKVVLIPGNGGSSVNGNWFPSVRIELEEAGLEVIARSFPDPELARASYWIPFLLNEVGVDERTILIGHSSGAIAAMKLAEQQRILGSVLVGAYHTDLGMETERASGYFDKPWQWERIKNNQNWIALFASQDDPWIPIDEARHIHTQLDCEYHEYKNQGHFGGDYDKLTFPELSFSIVQNLKRMEMLRF